MSLRSCLLVVALISTAGCGTADQNPDEEEDIEIPGSLFSTLQAKFAGQVLAGGIELTAFQYGSLIPNSALDNQCTTIGGDPTDADGDKIPVEGVLTLDCNKRFLGWSGSVEGRQTVTDTQPNAVAWAFTMDVDLNASVSGPFGGSAVNETAGSISAAQESTLGPYSLQAVFDATTSITTALGKQFDIAESVDWTVSYTPDIDWAPGAGVVVTGILDAGGTWDVGVNGKAAEATLSTPTPLVLDPECRPTRITGGSVQAGFEFEGKMATITVTWSGCDNSSVTYDHNVGGV